MFEVSNARMMQRMVGRFLDAVRDGDDLAGMFLSANYAHTGNVTKRASDGYENIPTVVSIADAYIDSNGFVWNERDFVAPSSCRSTENGRQANTTLPRGVESFEKVVVLTQEYGQAYYHFLVDNLPRITVLLDLLLEHPDIKIAAHETHSKQRREFIHQLFELLGIERDRVLFLPQVHADLAIIPPSTVCFFPNAVAIGMLRHALLQALYPGTSGVSPTLDRPVIVLIVRSRLRGLGNNAEVREALQQNFPAFDVVEFLGTGPIRSQLETFATASLVVAPHGAGLSNIIVSPLHTPVLEIGPINCPPCFLNLAVKLQHVYARHPGGNRQNQLCNSLFQPQVDEVVHLASELLEAQREAKAADTT